MQAGKKRYLSGAVTLSTHIKGKARKVPVWKLRYRLPDGSESEKILGKAWTKKGRPPEGFLTADQATAKKEEFLADHSGSKKPHASKSFLRAREDFIAHCTREKRLRASTIHGYEQLTVSLGRRTWRGQTWDSRPMGSFSDDDIITVREELLEAERAAETINHYRRILRGIFGTDRTSVALAFEWMAVKQDSDRLHVYTPQQIERLKAHAPDQLDRDFYTLATEAGLRQSEQIALKIVNCDFYPDASGMIRVEEALTAQGGEAGTKSHKVRAVPMSQNVHDMLRRRCEGRPEYDRYGNATYVFVQQGLAENEPISAVNLYRRFIKACERAGLPRIRYHDLRHTFGTQMVTHPGVNMDVLKNWMGHADLKTTQRYLHYKPEPEHGIKITEIFGHSADRAELIAMPATKPRRAPDCPKCGDPKAAGQPYCVKHMREARRASDARKQAS